MVLSALVLIILSFGLWYIKVWYPRYGDRSVEELVDSRYYSWEHNPFYSVMTEEDDYAYKFHFFSWNDMMYCISGKGKLSAEEMKRFVIVDSSVTLLNMDENNENVQIQSIVSIHKKSDEGYYLLSMQDESNLLLLIPRYFGSSMKKPWGYVLEEVKQDRESSPVLESEESVYSQNMESLALISSEKLAESIAKNVIMLKREGYLQEALIIGVQEHWIDFSKTDGQENLQRFIEITTKDEQHYWLWIVQDNIAAIMENDWYGNLVFVDITACLTKSTG